MKILWETAWDQAIKALFTNEDNNISAKKLNLCLTKFLWMESAHMYTEEMKQSH